MTLERLRRYDRDGSLAETIKRVKLLPPFGTAGACSPKHLVLWRMTFATQRPISVYEYAIRLRR